MPAWLAGFSEEKGADHVETSDSLPGVQIKCEFGRAGLGGAIDNAQEFDCVVNWNETPKVSGWLGGRVNLQVGEQIIHISVGGRMQM